MDYLSEISARINQVITHFAGGNVSKFSRMIDVIPDTVTTYLGKKGVIRMPGAEFISKMVDIFGISSDWILLGKGEMLKEDNYHVTQIYEPETLIVQEELEQAKKLIGTLQKTLDIINSEFSKTDEELEALRAENSRLKNMLAEKQYNPDSHIAAQPSNELGNKKNKE